MVSKSCFGRGVWLFVPLGGFLCGCSPSQLLDEPRAYAFEQELSQLRHWDWGTTARQSVGLRTGPGHTTTCTYLPTTHRATTQTGVSDKMMITECWDAARRVTTGPLALGQRMGNRPDPM
jgi:hypothetical protein